MEDMRVVARMFSERNILADLDPKRKELIMKGAMKEYEDIKKEERRRNPKIMGYCSLDDSICTKVDLSEFGKTHPCDICPLPRWERERRANDALWYRAVYGGF